jgi:lyso-ornithine lipid O-acyltransferase
MNTVMSLKNSFQVFQETYQALKKSNQPGQDINDLKSIWAQKVLSLMNVELNVIGKVEMEDSLLLVGNHISYLDIPLIMATVPKISFVAKKEISTWPIFGPAARRIETVFVQRETNASRKLARLGISQALSEGARVAIFPSGTTSLNESKTWRKGAFEIAHSQNVWVQPFRISYQPLRKVAFIDQDALVPHLFMMCGIGKIKTEIEFHRPVKISDPSFDCLYWNYWARGISIV